MKKAIILIFILSSARVYAQTNHWESIIIPGDSWSYLLPTSEPDPGWRNTGYDASAWSIGNSGFGYGDSDDNTVIATTLSVYIRKEFTISDKSAIEEMALSMDFDDSFIAYINGVKVARAFISGDPPVFDQSSDGLHEALLYQGFPPELFNIDQSVIDNLIEGTNVIAIQVHNQSLSSSDLSALPVLSVGINNSSSDYKPTPNWFSPPLAFTSSTLPIVTINTRGQSIVDEPKIPADFGIIYNGEGAVNHLSDPPNEYYGLCGIEIRGVSSQSFPKNSYGLETWDDLGNDLDTSFLNFPAEEDFILHGPYSDKSLLNNVLIMNLGNQLGHYASRTRLVELVINDDYRGVYVILEKIKRDNDRVDIAKLNPDEITGDDLTGGYIFKIDWYDGDGWHSRYNAYDSDHTIYFQYLEPDQEEIAPEQKNYIQNYMDDFEMAIASSTYKNAKGKHYLEYIDLRSFVDNFILNELSKNVDAYRLSTYFYKDKDSNGGKIKAGPLWDFNLAFGNGDYCGGDITTGWEYYQCVGSSPFWWHNMLNEEKFSNALRCRWEELRSTTLHTDNINAYLDSMTVILDGARERNFQRWPIMGSYVWPNSWFYASSADHDEVMGYMKEWLKDRSEWLDFNIPGDATECQIYEPPYTGLLGDHVLGFEEKSLKIDIYPNPVIDGLIKIQTPEPINEIALFDTAGQPILRRNPNGNSTILDLRPFSSGVYIIKISTGKFTTSQSIVIE